VFTADGKVIGIADQIATGGSASANTGVGFLVPIDLVKAELPQLKSGQSVRHAYSASSTADASTRDQHRRGDRRGVTGGPGATRPACSRATS
jgi:S1-C subfamily serine protease